MTRTGMSPPALAREIRRLIQQGEFRAGDHLGTVELAARFGVSRGPIREALRLLESLHIVKLLPQKGAFVARLVDEDAREVMGIREVLFGRLAELAAERRTECSIKRLENKLLTLQALARNPDTTPREFQHTTYSFVGVMYSIAQSPRLAGMIIDLTEGMGDLYGHLSMATADMRATELTAYEALFEAIREGDAARAGQQARQMHARGAAVARELQLLLPASSQPPFKGKRRRRGRRADLSSDVALDAG